eukprot:GHVS01029990.1.p1 GENE.GHVS01029990.1~~GHVS01029990.1.p1  ORF type:complete len:318 (+),score=21.20 GHVS01029990.1:205-1158(+)
MLTIVSRFREVAETTALLHLNHSVCSLTRLPRPVPSGIRALCSSQRLGNCCVKRNNGRTRSVLPAKKTDEFVNGSSLGFSIYVDESTLHGLGVFAGRSFEPGEVVEVCPVLELPRVSPDLVAQTSPVGFRSDPLLGTTERHHRLVVYGNPHSTALKETMETIADYVFDNGTDSDSDCQSSPKVTNAARHSNSRKVSSSDGYSQGGSLLAFGYGMVYNHSNNPNAYSKLVYDYLNVPYRKNEQSEASLRNDRKDLEDVRQERKEVRQKRKVLRIKTLQKIKQGNEIFIHYGDDWWKNRRSVPLSFNFSRFRGTLLDDD